MATQTIERTEQVTQADIDRLNIPGQGEPFTTGVKVYSPAARDEKEVEEKETQTVTGAVVKLPAPLAALYLIAKIAGRTVAYYDWLSGPPRSERDRNFSEQARARGNWTNYW